MSNMEIYDSFRVTPKEAQKEIAGGRLRGFTDINPMYRIQKLTEKFGPCGIGWYYEPVKKWIEQAGDEIMAFVDISLFIKVGGEWSKPIAGTGGSALYVMEKGGLKASDECFKMATTDAISVACKQLGIGADVYWKAGESKYSRPDSEPVQASKPDPKAQRDEQDIRTERIKALCKYHNITSNVFNDYMKELKLSGKVPNKQTKDMTEQDFNVSLSLVHAALNETRQPA